MKNNKEKNLQTFISNIEVTLENAEILNFIEWLAKRIYLEFGQEPFKLEYSCGLYYLPYSKTSTQKSYIIISNKNNKPEISIVYTIKDYFFNNWTTFAKPIDLDNLEDSIRKYQYELFNNSIGVCQNEKN